MQSANWKPGKLHTLSQHAVEANHGMRKLRHTIPAYTVQAHIFQHSLHRLTCIKEATKAQNSGQADTAMHCTTRRTRGRGTAEQAATTP